MPTQQQMEEAQQHWLNVLTRMAVAMGWEKEQQPDTSRNHSPNNFASHFGPASLKQMVPSTAGCAMEGKESILVGQLFQLQLISQALQ